MFYKDGMGAEKLQTSIPLLKPEALKNTFCNLCAGLHYISRKLWQNWTAGPSTSCSTSLLLEIRWPETVRKYNEAAMNPSILPRHVEWTAGRSLPSTLSTEDHADAAGYYSSKYLEVPPFEVQELRAPDVMPDEDILILTKTEVLKPGRNLLRSPEVNC